MADDHERDTNRYHPHDEQHYWHVEIELQLKDQLLIALNLEERQPLSMTPVMERRLSRAMVKLT
jgi:hypothetical protein